MPRCRECSRREPTDETDARGRTISRCNVDGHLAKGRDLSCQDHYRRAYRYTYVDPGMQAPPPSVPPTTCPRCHQELRGRDLWCVVHGSFEDLMPVSYQSESLPVATVPRRWM
jgi:hypothetical protein